MGIVTGYGLDIRGLSPSKGKNYLFFISSKLAKVTQPPIEWVPGTSSLGVKRPGREVNRLHPTSAKVKKTCINTYTVPYVFLV